MRTWLFSTLFFLGHLSLLAATREGQWKLVQEAISKGLPKTAITNLEPIIAGALRDKAYAEAVKAIGQKIALEGTVQGNKPEEKIVRLEAEIAKAPPEMVPVMDTLLAHWYWDYFRQNRWRFMQRTTTAASPGKDFTAWDLPRLLLEIDRQFQKALGAEKILKATPIGGWNDLLQKGTVPDVYRPTLYDFIAQEALQFYTSGEQAAVQPEDAFELSADGPAFENSQHFLEWRPEERPGGTTATGNSGFAPILRALHLYQELIRFHKNDPVPQLALADADLGRLIWAWNTATGEEKAKRYKAALEEFIRTWADFDVSALALERQARVFQQENDLVAAHQLAQRGTQLFPQSPGGKLCHNLVTEIEAKSAAIATERVWNCFPGSPSTEDCPKIQLRYRNVAVIYFRAIAYDWELFLQKKHHRPEALSSEEQREVLAKVSSLDWAEKLPATVDYQEREIQLLAPDKLKPGFYFIVASHDPGFGEKDNVVSLADVWVSGLSLVTRSRLGQIEGFVMGAASGDPIAGAAISCWHLDRNGNRITDPALTTDADGFFSFKAETGFGYLLRARFNGNEVATGGDVFANGPMEAESAQPFARTVFFTDRALYRPGQIVQYKGICLWVDQSKDAYEVLKGEELEVVFLDQQGKAIDRQKVRANDYGSFAGSFTAPRDRLLGPMHLQAQGRAAGDAWFRVEEYKRPKFEVGLDAPRTAARLNERVDLSGHAMSYTGAAVDGASVKYRVVREVRMPWWWGWWRTGRQPQASQEIAHGIARTQPDGSFTIEFTARPDLSVPEKDEPSFLYRVNADITDTTGETRSSERVVRVGYTALEAILSAEEWQTATNPIVLKVEAKTLDGEPQMAEGRVSIYELQPPSRAQRGPLAEFSFQPWRAPAKSSRSEDGELDLSDPNNWPLGKVVVQNGFATDTNGIAKLSVQLPAGAYRALLDTQDRFGKKVTGILPLQVLDPPATNLVIRIPHLLEAPAWVAQPGREFSAVWGTGYETGRAFVEIEHRGRLIERYWTKPGQTQQQIKLAVTEAMRGGFTLHVTQVKENRAYLESRKIEVPWLNKELDLTWEHLVSKLEPGQKETWTAVIKPTRSGAAQQTPAPGGSGKEQSPVTSASFADKAVAEMVATLYDESLDAFAPHGWPSGFGVFRQDYSRIQVQFSNVGEGFRYSAGAWRQSFEQVDQRYRSFPPSLVYGVSMYKTRGGGMGMVLGRSMEEAAFKSAQVQTANEPMVAARLASFDSDGMAQAAVAAGVPAEPSPHAEATARPALDQVTARKNLNETAFFFPQLTSDTNGTVRMTFTMPQALTRWRFLGFAHDRVLRGGLLEAHAVTSKDLMVQPNPPRFLREGDTIEFTVKVSNQSDKTQTGRVRLSFTDSLSAQSADTLLNLRPVGERSTGTAGRSSPSETPAAKGGIASLEQDFEIPSKQSLSFSWRLTVPDGCGFLNYKAVAAGAGLSDGEEGSLPVLSRRILVTESLPLPIRGPAKKSFEFTKLLKSGSSKTLRNQNLTVQMVSNPAWYAVLALPYLMEYPYECSEQTFNRLYANCLARTIATSDPKIHRVFDQWRNTPALDSPLEKNLDLKGILLEETPWLRQVQSESGARKNVGVLFDDNRMNYEIDRTLQKLRELQLTDGWWPWFPGGTGNEYITLYITTGFGRLRHLGVDIGLDPAIRSLLRLDARMKERYDKILTLPGPEKYVPSSIDALYLYGRSFYLKDVPIAEIHKKAVDFYLSQSRKFWLETGCRQTQGQLALALQRFGAADSVSDPTPKAIMASLKEHSVTSEEMGMFWRDAELSWWWYRAPIETQALMIEAFDEVARDQHSVEDCKVWLLKQKQTQDWKTTKATADAVYALLLRGKDLLSSTALVQVSLGGRDITPAGQEVRSSKPETRKKVPKAASDRVAAPEAGTGFYEVRFQATEIKPNFGEIMLRKVDAGVAWGSINWQYHEDIAKVSAYEGTPLKLKKTLFTRASTGRGQVLEVVKGPIHVGDELIVRIELRVDRDMEYVHLKDQRGSGTEPVNVLSQYKYQDGLAYYESTRDTASHFFIDYLPKGTYVFEYATRVQLRGQYQTGLAEIQCLYAPEFNSHSESIPILVE